MAAPGCEPRGLCPRWESYPRLQNLRSFFSGFPPGPGLWTTRGRWEVGLVRSSSFQLALGALPLGARWALQATLSPTNSSGCERGGPRLGSRAEPGRSNKWTWTLGKRGFGPRIDKGRLFSDIPPTWSFRPWLGHLGPASVVSPKEDAQGLGRTSVPVCF